MTIQYYLITNPSPTAIGDPSVGIVGTCISIPPDPNNTRYQKYLEWVAEGNTPLPADPGEE